MILKMLFREEITLKVIVMKRKKILFGDEAIPMGVIRATEIEVGPDNNILYLTIDTGKIEVPLSPETSKFWLLYSSTPKEDNVIPTT